jgi:hypothetical protein
MLQLLERHYYNLTSRQYSEDLSFEIIELLRELLSDEERTAFKQLIDEFVVEHGDHLEEMYRTRVSLEDVNPLVFQPEGILILERLLRDPFALKERWEQEFPADLLEEFATIWGIEV